MHPSEPNYLDLFSGSNQGVTDDSVPHSFSAPNLASELLSAGFSFGGYSESLPYPGFTGGSFANAYFAKHNPWVAFTNVPAADNMPFTGYFPSNYAQLPTVSIVVPNIYDDMHSGPIQQGDAWLRANPDTVRAFKEILEGKHDEVPEGNFYMKGGIEEIKEG